MLSPPSIPSDWWWVIALGWVVWQIYAPKLFNVETRFEEIVKGLNERIDCVGDRLDDIEERQNKHATITGTIALEADDVDGKKVQDILSRKEHLDPDDIVHDDPFVVGDGGHIEHEE